MLETLAPDLLVLQYTPLMYAGAGGMQNAGLARFWSECGARWRTVLVVHETYFRTWRHPPSLIKGSMEKWMLKRMVQASHKVFTASEPLFEEIRRWGVPATSVSLLPIGSGIPRRAIDRGALRRRHGIGEGEVILALFGGGEALHQSSSYANEVDAEMTRRGIQARWLLLGAVERDWFKFTLPVISPGYLPAEDLSAWLQVADILLAPHSCGMSAKRSGVMAALEHGLPVVGTRGAMTDSFWSGMEGVSLVEMPGERQFAESAARLGGQEQLRRKHGEANRSYFEANLTWKKLTNQLLEAIPRQ